MTRKSRSPATAGQRRELTPAQKSALAEGRKLGTWRKGQSGNPAGLKPGLKDLRELLELAMQKRDPGSKGTRLERMVIAIARKLAVGEERAVEFVGRRIWPAPVMLDLEGIGTSLRAAEEALEARIERTLARRVNGETPLGPFDA